MAQKNTAAEEKQLKSANAEPLYKQLERHLRSEILGGKLKPGDKIQTEDELSADDGRFRPDFPEIGRCVDSMPAGTDCTVLIDVHTDVPDTQ